MNREFIDNAVDTGKRVLRNVGQTACELAEAARIRYRIAELKTEMNRNYRKLGKLAYDAMDVGVLAMDEGMQEIYNKITDLKQQIAALKEDL